MRERETNGGKELNDKFDHSFEFFLLLFDGTEHRVALLHLFDVEREEKERR